MATLNGNLELLLANATDLAPTLAEGLSEQALGTISRPSDELYPERFVDDMGDPNDLRYQRWGIAAPEGPEGDLLLDVIRPLIALREQEQGSPATIYRVPRGLNTEAAFEWRERVLFAEDFVNSPRYLFLIGGLDSISLDFQEVLSRTTFVGRFHAESVAGYEAYVEKVCRWSQAPLDDQTTRIVFHVTRDGTAATSMAHRNLMAPCEEMMLRAASMGETQARIEILGSHDSGIETADDFLRVASATIPTIALSANHSLGAPAEGWATEEERRRNQGNLLFRSHSVLSAGDVANWPFYPGGIWMNVASFSAATPEHSVYEHWLRGIVDGGFMVRGPSMNAIFANLPRNGERPFLSALAQAALTNPKGPLAIIGKKDLAWTYTGIESRRRRDASTALYQVMQGLTHGSRIGVAFGELGRMSHEATMHLTDLFDRDERRRSMAQQAEPVDSDFGRRGFSWLLGNDVRTYMLLGDPAVRLPRSQGRGP